MATRAHTVPRFFLKGFVAPESERSPDPFLWIGSLETGEIKCKSPKNISIERGYYDGPGCFENSDASIEAHLAVIESAASLAIRKFAAADPSEGASPSSEIWRFLAWQAARTPGWMELEEDWVYFWDPNTPNPVIEPPPKVITEMKDRARKHILENPDSGERHETTDFEEFKVYRKKGWKWIMDQNDKLESMHIQAWYFQVRHFPNLSWTRLNAPEDQWFIINDRGLSWMADGYADTPPSALRHPTAQVVAPLTRKVALIGRHTAHELQVTPREVNRFIASTASDWIAGPTRNVVEQAIEDRSRYQGKAWGQM